ncbi:hypothetical protein [Actinoplanes couchii]|uniref:MftR C-terminal domain-containing protein n=1 Tax=Actinoplanes couchii TaxID=403638 RepID=A0ABQ3XR23_9ACTN|nr:hypothetical protein [Actinoplanes couchii]MDR6318824.1 hypothetical protein [Actinoplanes couchii]GID60855.1 hypothetical protein Aco03nite_092590 [Actinoplanes couchii]
MLLIHQERVRGPTQDFARRVSQLVFSTPPLLAAYVQKLHPAQEVTVAAVLSRAKGHGVPYAQDDPTPCALTAAAFGCLIAVQHSWLASGGEQAFAEVLGRALDAIEPTA